jgi:predicted Fe-S protein YdhL (DUF1289 family)
MKKILTPCIKVCKISYKTNTCVGCRRTIIEIQNWTQYSEQQKLEIMLELLWRKKDGGKN